MAKPTKRAAQVAPAPRSFIHSVRTTVSSATKIYKKCTCGWTFEAKWRDDYQHIKDAGDAVSAHLKEHS